jgi:hypothetical protein
VDTHVPGYPVRDWSDAELTTIAERLLLLHPELDGCCLGCGAVGDCQERTWATAWIRSSAGPARKHAPVLGLFRGVRDGRGGCAAEPGRGGRRAPGPRPGSGRRVTHDSLPVPLSWMALAQMRNAL